MRIPSNTARETYFYIKGEPHKLYLLEPPTEEEFKVLKCVAQGKRNKEIAQELYKTVDTVKSQVRSLLHRCYVDSREGLVIAYSLLFQGGKELLEPPSEDKKQLLNILSIQEQAVAGFMIDPFHFALPLFDAMEAFNGAEVFSRMNKIVVFEYPTNADIARFMILSPNTIKTHVSGVLNKLCVDSRDEAIFKYRRSWVDLYGGLEAAKEKIEKHSTN